ncbi:hypothetical protein ACFLYU_03775 [Candidatus Dependentiae bacterium]
MKKIFIFLFILTCMGSFATKVTVDVKYCKGDNYCYKRLVGVGESIIAMLDISNIKKNSQLTVIKDLKTGVFYGCARARHWAFHPKNWHTINPKKPKLCWGKYGSYDPKLKSCVVKLLSILKKISKKKKYKTKDGKKNWKIKIKI